VLQDHTIPVPPTHTHHRHQNSLFFFCPLFSVLFSTDLNRSDEKWTHDEYARFYNDLDDFSKLFVTIFALVLSITTEKMTSRLKQGMRTVTNQLIPARCNVDLQTERDGSVTKQLIADPQESMLQLLQQRCNSWNIRSSLRVDLQTDNGSNALHVAAHLGHASVARCSCYGCPR
jgi:hypothetical protein